MQTFFFPFVFPGFSEEDKHVEEEMESDKENSDEEMESGSSRPELVSVDGQNAQAAARPLTKAQIRELRRVKKLDQGWMSNILDTWTWSRTKTGSHTRAVSVQSFHRIHRFFYMLCSFFSSINKPEFPFERKRSRKYITEILSNYLTLWISFIHFNNKKNK